MSTFNTDTFIKNVTKYKRGYPIVFYSDRGMWDNVTRNHIAQPDSITRKRLAMNNIVFMNAIDIALRGGYEFFFYLEEDCRVHGDFWDKRIFSEFDFGRHLVGGTPSLWNIGVCGNSAQMSAIKFINKTVKMTGRAPLMWQRDGRTAEQLGLWLYPNGALGIYHTATMDQIFHGRKVDMQHFAENMGAWDVLIGKAMWNQFGINELEKFSILPSVFSGYKDTQYSMSERQKMLVTGKVAAVHQIKTNWCP